MIPPLVEPNEDTDTPGGAPAAEPSAPDAARLRQLGAFLRECLGGRTHAQLAQEVGVTRSTITRILAGQWLPKAPLLSRIARALNVEVAPLYALAGYEVQDVAELDPMVLSALRFFSDASESLPPEARQQLRQGLLLISEATYLAAREAHQAKEELARRPPLRTPELADEWLVPNEHGGGWLWVDEETLGALGELAALLRPGSATQVQEETKERDMASKAERPITEGLKDLPASVVEKILKKAAELSKKTQQNAETLEAAPVIPGALAPTHQLAG